MSHITPGDDVLEERKNIPAPPREMKRIPFIIQSHFPPPFDFWLVEEGVPAPGNQPDGRNNLSEKYLVSPFDVCRWEIDG